MKLIEKDNDTMAQLSKWYVEEIKKTDDLMRLVAKVSSIGKMDCIEFHGYEDMDEHTNWAVFESVEEMKNGIGDIEKINPDTAKVRASVDGDSVIISFYHIDNMKNGITMSLLCSPKVTDKVSKALEQKVREVAK